MKKINLFSHCTVAILIMAIGSFTFVPNFTTAETVSLAQHSNDVAYAQTATNTAEGDIHIPTSILATSAVLVGAMLSVSSGCHYAKNVDLAWSDITEKEFEMNLLP